MAFLIPFAGEIVGALWELSEAVELSEISFQTAAIVDAGATVMTAQIAAPVIIHGLKSRGRSTAESTSTDPPGSDLDYHYAFETPGCTPDTLMNGVPSKRPTNPIETPKPKRVYEEVDNKHDRDVRLVTYTGPSYSAGWCRDFSAIQRTRVNPVTGRIIGYKGIPRKRALSPISKYSSFWREQKYAKPSQHASRSPGIWDSARR